MTAQIIQTNICESCLDIKKKIKRFFYPVHLSWTLDGAFVEKRISFFFFLFWFEKCQNPRLYFQLFPYATRKPLPLEKRRDRIQKKKKINKKMGKYYFTNVLRHTHKRASGDVCCVYIYIYRVPLSSYFVWLFVVCPMIEFFFYQQLLPAGMIYSRCSACYRSVVHLYVGDSIQ